MFTYVWKFDILKNNTSFNFFCQLDINEGNN